MDEVQKSRSCQLTLDILCSLICQHMMIGDAGLGLAHFRAVRSGAVQFGILYVNLRWLCMFQHQI